MTPWTAACQASLSFTISLGLLKLVPIELVMPSNHLILCGPLLLLSSIFPSIKVFFNELALHIKWPKYCSFSFSISLTDEYLRLVSSLVWSPCCPRDSSESSPEQFESTNSSVLSLLYGSTLTSIHDCWTNYSFDYSLVVYRILVNLCVDFSKLAEFTS